MSKNLVIVESPAKAKTIEKILGKDFTVKSCYGHIRDLPKGDKAIDIQNGFHPSYEVPGDKAEVVNELKSLVKKSDQVWLATDEDREGEAISWHLCEVLDLDESLTKRIVFHEITKPAIDKAIKNPRLLDKNLVFAQQARRVLDRLVGFELSPVLWKKVNRTSNLSAGRVQSVAVRLIVEREKEIGKHESSSQFKISALFEIKDSKNKTYTFKAELPKKIETKEQAEDFLKSCIKAQYTVGDVNVKPGYRKPAAPFTTSTLQQEASRKYGFSVSKTMMLAQRLYEAGKITYMRTDSVNLSETALTAMATMIESTYGAKYVNIRKYTTKTKVAQEAHEAIRPTYFENQTEGQEADEKKLYSLIWKRAVASQMSDAQLEKTTVSINISTNKDQLQAYGEVVIFDGFLKLYQESTDDDEEDSATILPPLQVGKLLDFIKMDAIERFSRPASRYTEATLVKKLEELGIGRPSTYAPTISTIQNRKYVNKENREGTERFYKTLLLQNDKISEATAKEITGAEKAKLFPTDMGILVSDFLVQHFPEIINYNFTAKIEEEFDQIANGELIWNDMLKEFYGPFHLDVTKTLETAEKVTGIRELGIHPKSGKPVVARLGRFGPMIQIGATEDEEKPLFASLRSDQSINTISLEEALSLFNLPRIAGKFEDKEMKVAAGRFGPYVLHDGAFYSLKKEMDPYTVSEQECVQLIIAKREADANKHIKSFDQDETVQILQGRWGPYIKAGDQNFKIPKGVLPIELSYEQVKEIMATTTPSGRGARANVRKTAASATPTGAAQKEKPATKKQPAKKTAAKKSATKKTAAKKSAKK